MKKSVLGNVLCKLIIGNKEQTLWKIVVVNYNIDMEKNKLQPWERVVLYRTKYEQQHCIGEYVFDSKTKLRDVEGFLLYNTTKPNVLRKTDGGYFLTEYMLNTLKKQFTNEKQKISDVYMGIFAVLNSSESNFKDGRLQFENDKETSSFFYTRVKEYMDFILKKMKKDPDAPEIFKTYSENTILENYLRTFFKKSVVDHFDLWFHLNKLCLKIKSCESSDKITEQDVVDIGLPLNIMLTFYRHWKENNYFETLLEGENRNIIDISEKVSALCVDLYFEMCHKEIL